jgi:hypothetical protein
MHVRSIGLERRYNYLIVITRVTRSQEQIEPASSRSEKRIISKLILWFPINPERLNECCSLRYGEGKSDLVRSSGI